MLERLHTVQTLDIEIDRLQLEETRIPGDLAGAREEKARLEGLLRQTRDDHHTVRREVNAADLELRDLTAKRERARNDQKGAGNAKEQTQYENLIQQLSGRIEELENDSLPLVERMEKLEAEAGSLEAQLADLAPRLAHLEGMDEDRIAALRRDRDAKIDERRALAGGIDPKLLREYDAIRKAKRGVGIVPAKGSKCGGCNVQLPLNVQQRVRSGAVPVKCPSCGRLLWSGE